MMPCQFTCALADASCGGVDDAEEADIVIIVLDDTEVGDDVLHIATIKETAGSHDSIRDLSLAELAFQNAALVVCAEEHSHVIELVALAVHLQHLVGDQRGLLLLVLGGDDTHRVLAFVLAPETLAATSGIVLDEAVRGVEDGRGAAIIFLELDHRRIREEGLELIDVRDVRAAPAIDGLVIITHDADVVRRRHQRPQHPHLERVGVLELVHHHKTILRLRRLTHLGMVFEKDHCIQQQVIEIHRVQGAHLIRVKLEQRAEQRLHGVAEALALDLGVLGLADLA